MSRLLIQTEFAKFQGFSDAYLRALIRKGVVIPIGGKIDTDQAVAAIEANRTPQMQKRIPMVLVAASPKHPEHPDKNKPFLKPSKDSCIIP